MCVGKLSLPAGKQAVEPRITRIPPCFPSIAESNKPLWSYCFCHFISWGDWLLSVSLFMEAPWDVPLNFTLSWDQLMRRGGPAGKGKWIVGLEESTDCVCRCRCSKGAAGPWWLCCEVLAVEGKWRGDPAWSRATCCQPAAQVKGSLSHHVVSSQTHRPCLGGNNAKMIILFRPA